MKTSQEDSHPPLARRLGLTDAVVLGLGSMLGAGVFGAFAPAAAAAGAGLLVALAIAAGVAYCNGIASAQLAVRYPESGGTYRYGRHRLGPAWGFLAGWGFVIGKTASCAAMAMTFGAYAWPAHPTPPAVAAVAVLTAANARRGSPDVRDCPFWPSYERNGLRSPCHRRRACRQRGPSPSPACPQSRPRW